VEAAHRSPTRNPLIGALRPLSTWNKLPQQRALNYTKQAAERLATGSAQA
jgi:hypothetical protein